MARLMYIRRMGGFLHVLRACLEAVKPSLCSSSVERIMINARLLTARRQKSHLLPRKRHSRLGMPSPSISICGVCSCRPVTSLTVPLTLQPHRSLP
ncbi:hypothetical protein NCU17032 [Neurospora crassa OR74A]|uniref:Uncharacterized protein n=1 Tax=Neurospora crassa (strain ATCC 24698 / 74-OR23-1A / CBS 708.71 / DSM 1257 / FGSC 987) TaxID=367110 RepID=V5IM05_NEUCR|nr:hypothetical protein NCU17032 [Neurospora crassa OR74A]ESA42692.1 hypothetical protein NCU17032 [Neurospora crassa OR74A]|eukprot:XP_011394851.1 hypothetical protein NCU17032 [Neurospora crassa OR74A]